MNDHMQQSDDVIVPNTRVLKFKKLVVEKALSTLMRLKRSKKKMMLILITTKLPPLLVNSKLLLVKTIQVTCYLF